MKYLYIITALALGTMVSHAQNTSLTFNADAALFRYDSERQLWEWYYAFPDTALSYVQRGDNYVGEMYCSIVISDTTGIVASEEWIVANTNKVAVTTHERDLIGVKQFALRPGRYTAECVVADMAARRDTLYRTFHIVIPAPVTDRLALSDIEIATSLRMREESDAENSSYRKGAFMIVPNPALTYIVTPEQPEQDDSFTAGDGALLPYYVEIYNASRLSPQGVHMRYRVLDVTGTSKLAFDKKLTPAGEAVADYGLIPVDTLPSGIYYLHVSMYGTGEAAADSAGTYKKFYVLNANREAVFRIASESQEFEMSEFAIMADERVMEEQEKIRPLLTLQEKETFALLTDLKAQQKFLFRFWKNRDYDPTTSENEALNEFRQLVDYANNYFSTIQTQGWRTDRGRVLRQYGKPDKVDIKQFTTEAKPYSQWYYYNIQGGIEFCFVELGGTEDFTLVHSTAKNEVREAKWYERYAQILGSATFSR